MPNPRASSQAAARSPARGRGPRVRQPRRNTKPAAPRPGPDVPIPTGSQEDYNRYLPEAQKLGRSEITPLRCDAHLAVFNAGRGAEAVLAQADRIRDELPRISLEAIRSLPSLGLAVLYAVGQVDRVAPAPSEVRALMSRSNQLRTMMLASADALAKAGVLPGAAVAKIHEGHGAIDAASDCVALAALFQKNAADVRGKSPVTAANVREASELGSQLLSVLQPRSARKNNRRGGKEISDAVEARDRLWTLFARTWHDQIWRAGAWLFGRQVDSRVPALASRVSAKRSKKAPGDGNPAPTDVK